MLTTAVDDGCTRRIRRQNIVFPGILISAFNVIHSRNCVIMWNRKLVSIRLAHGHFIRGVEHIAPKSDNLLLFKLYIHVDKFPKKKRLNRWCIFLTVGTVVWCQSVPYPTKSSAFETEHFYTYGTLKWIQSFSYRNKFPISHYNAVRSTRMDDIECRNQDPRKDYILSADSPSTPVVNRSGENYWSLRRHGFPSHCNRPLYKYISRPCTIRTKIL